MRAYAWYGICWGAKGIQYNTLGSDGGGNIGICGYKLEHDRDYDIIKDEDVPNSNFLEFLNRFSLGTCLTPGLSIVDPTLSQSQWATESLTKLGWAIATAKKTDPNQQDERINFSLLVPNNWQVGFSGTVDDYVAANYSTLITNHINVGDIYNGWPNFFPRSTYDPNDWLVIPTPNNHQWTIITSSCSTIQASDPTVFTNCTSPTARRWWEAPHFDGEYWMGYYSIHSPHLKLYTPWYYGYKEHWFAARKIMQDIKPVAQTISEVVWQRLTVDASKLNTQSVTTTDGDKLPILWYEKSSQKITGNDPLGNPPDEPAVYSYDKTRPDRYLFNVDQNKAHLESQQDALYEFGLFKVPKEEDALYVAMLNRRTWPVRFKNEDNIEDWPNSKILSDNTINDDWVDDTTDILRNDKWYENSDWHSDELEGAIDVRRFSFRINRKAFTDGETISHFVVTNMRTGRERLIAFNTATGDDIEFVDTFSVVLEPGEGTLFKISPAHSMAAGMTSEAGMAYNNGHRIADIGNFIPTSRKKIMVWERNGDIEYRITNNRVPQPPLENVFDQTLSTGSVISSAQSLKNLHPSVAASGNNVVVVYSRETTDESVRQVFARWGIFNPGPNTITWKDPFPLDNSVLEDETTEPNQLITPVVTPGANGFLCAWSSSDINDILTEHGIQLKYIILDENQDVAFNPTQPAPPVIQNEPTIISEIFPSLASRSEDAGISQMERFHLAWEGVFNFNTGESQIYYTRFEHDQNDNWATLTTERVTKFVEGCKHHHPNIAVKNEVELVGDVENAKVHGEPIVTWDREEDLSSPIGGNGQEPMSIESYPGKGKTSSVMVRHRSHIGVNNWSTITTLWEPSNPVSLPMIKSGMYIDRTWPTIGNPLSTGTAEYLTYMSSKKSQVLLTRFKAITPFNHKPTFHAEVPERGSYPNLTLNYEGKALPSLNTLTFRGMNTFIDEFNNTLYHARVTAPLVDDIAKSYDKIKVKTFNALKELCKRNFSFSVGNPNLRPAIWCTGCPDTIYFNIGRGIPIPWNNYDITDTRPGYYSESDTTIFNWPRTEDSVRTENFAYSLGDTLSFDRMFYMEDTAWVKTLINDSTLAEITYSVLLKDSASGQTISVLDQITIDTASIDIAVKRFGEDNIASVSTFLPPMPPPTSFYVPQGPGRKVQWIANAPAPSGKAYITIHASKDEDMPVVMSQEHGEYDDFNVIIPTFDTALFKQAGQQPITVSAPTTPITLSINPNPFEGSTKVTVETVKDVPLSVQAYNVLGGLVVNLFNDVSTQTHYEFTLDSKIIRPGTYFIRGQAGNGIVTKKVQFVK